MTVNLFYEGPERGTGIGLFLPWQTGFRSLGMGKYFKLGMG